MKTKKKPKIQFAVCISNEGYPASLEVGKLYRIIRDEKAEERGYIRIIDESGEDYAYSSNRFFPIEVPQKLMKALVVAV